MPRKPMKLFVWQDVLWDYTDGMIVALAPDLETALALARDSEFYGAPGDMGKTEPEVIDLGRVDAEPKLWAVHGGG